MGIFGIMAPRFCRQRQAAIESRLANMEDTLAALGGTLRRLFNLAVDIQGRVIMADKNLDAIAADLPALLSGVGSAVSKINDLSTQLKNTDSSDPRAADLDAQIKAASQSIQDALGALSPPAATPPAEVTPPASSGTPASPDAGTAAPTGTPAT